MTHPFSLPGLGNIVGDGSEADQEARCNLDSDGFLCDKLSMNLSLTVPQFPVISLPGNLSMFVNCSVLGT